jgi:hypothetical protein
MRRAKGLFVGGADVTEVRSIEVDSNGPDAIRNSTLIYPSVLDNAKP